MTPQSFGGQLRKLREQRRVTLEQIVERTKVSLALLRALENGGCEGWPGGIYSRGYVRAYAKAIGVDPEQVLEAFLECYPAFAPDVGADPPIQGEDAPRSPVKRIKDALTGLLKITDGTPDELEPQSSTGQPLPNDNRARSLWSS